MMSLSSFETDEGFPQGLNALKTPMATIALDTMGGDEGAGNSGSQPLNCPLPKMPVSFWLETRPRSTRFCGAHAMMPGIWPYNMHLST